MLKTTREVFLALVAIAVGLGLLGFVGMSGLAGFDAPTWARALFRSIALLIVPVVVIMYLRIWGRRHRTSFSEADPAVQVKRVPAIRPWDDVEKLRHIHEESLKWSGIDQSGVESLIVHLTEPERMRRKIIERVAARVHQTVHQVDISWDPSSAPPATPKIGKQVVMLLMRRLKNPSERLTELEVRDGSVMGGIATAGLMYHLACRRLGLPSSAAPFDGYVALRQALVSMIIEDESVAVLPSSALLNAAPQKPSVLTIRFLKEIRERRPYLAILKAKEVERSGSTAFTYRARIAHPRDAPQIEGWRRFKDACRRRLTHAISLRLVYIPLDRGRTTDRYFLYVDVPESLYVEEANVWFMRPHMTMSRSDSREVHQMFLDWSVPNGSAFAWFRASRLRSSKLTRDSYFVLRLTEKPPGLLAGASVAAFASVLTTWVGAIVSNSQGGATDVVALVLALPAFVSSFFELRQDGFYRALRSITASASLIFSVVLSVLTIAYFLLVNQRSIESTRNETSLKLFFVADWGWWILLGLAVVNFALVTGTMFMRMNRYADQVANARR